eukprot:scaffold196557_cov18-Tisochrysis_lutea.AAC.1
MRVATGDWFNAIDWTCSTHKLGIGLPVRTKNEPGWFYKAPILTNKNIRPSPDQMKACNKAFRELLRIRCVWMGGWVHVCVRACVLAGPFDSVSQD